MFEISEILYFFYKSANEKSIPAIPIKFKVSASKTYTLCKS